MNGTTPNKLTTSYTNPAIVEKIKYYSALYDFGEEVLLFNNFFANTFSQQFKAKVFLTTGSELIATFCKT